MNDRKNDDQKRPSGQVSLIQLHNSSSSPAALSDLVKVRLTSNMTFGLRNIWIIIRRNAIYLYSKKKLVLIDFSALEATSYPGSCLVPRVLPMGKTLVGAGHVTLQK
jgi:hypothetical protein